MNLGLSGSLFVGGAQGIPPSATIPSMAQSSECTQHVMGGLKYSAVPVRMAASHVDFNPQDHHQVGDGKAYRTKTKMFLDRYRATNHSEDQPGVSSAKPDPFSVDTILETSPKKPLPFSIDALLAHDSQKSKGMVHIPTVLIPPVFEAPGLPMYVPENFVQQYDSHGACMGRYSCQATCS